jgi:K+-sensing histidine kinase KdpD
LDKHTERVDAERPSAQEMLERVRLQAGAGAHGRLRVYLGMAPGVGKTYAMLMEGQRRKERGTDVVIGFVETYGRPLTIQAIGEEDRIQGRDAGRDGHRGGESPQAAGRSGG